MRPVLLAALSLLLLGFVILVVSLVVVLARAASARAKLVPRQHEGLNDHVGTGPRDDAADWQTVVHQLGLTASDELTLSGIAGQVPIRVRRLIPRAMRNPERQNSPKTEIRASVATQTIGQFIMHERGPVVLGRSSSSGDAEFDTRFVIRSNDPPTVRHLWTPEVKEAVRAYAAIAPSCGVTNDGVELLIEGAVPSVDYIRQIIHAQVRIVEALESAALRAR